MSINKLMSAIILLCLTLVLATTSYSQGKPVNQFLYSASGWTMVHGDPQNSDVIHRYSMPTGNLKAAELDVNFLPFNHFNWGLGC